LLTEAVNVIESPTLTSDGQLTETVGQGATQPVQLATVTVALDEAVCVLPSLTSTEAV
jgi:hypothetical protein